jgi:hypothetical protein
MYVECLVLTPHMDRLQLKLHLWLFCWWVAKVKYPKYHERDQDASTTANMQQIPPNQTNCVFI